MDNSKDDLTSEDIALVSRFESFYRSLENGDREPTTEAQKHFVAVCKRGADITTPHELAWMRYKNKVNKDGESSDIIKGVLDGNATSPSISSQQFSQETDIRNDHKERDRIMALIRTSRQPYSRLELIMIHAGSIGLTGDDKSEILKMMEEVKPRNRTPPASPVNYVVVFSNTDGQ